MMPCALDPLVRPERSVTKLATNVANSCRAGATLFGTVGAVTLSFANCTSNSRAPADQLHGSECSHLLRSSSASRSLPGKPQLQFLYLTDDCRLYKFRSVTWELGRLCSSEPCELEL